jgi:imidazolonepropionase
MLADFLIHNASEILTCAGPAPRRGRGQSAAGAVHGGVVASSGGTIVYVGPAEDWQRQGTLTPNATVVDAAGGSVVPGLVDAHTHVVFAGDRHGELRRRLAGATYADIAATGGGILATVRATRSASEEELTAVTRDRLDEMLRCGTTTCEAKTGYGLTTESELKLLRVIARLQQEHPIGIAATFMGAHEVPEEYSGRRNDYVAMVRREMLPAVAASGLAEWCDVFCEEGVFTPDQARAILADARSAGLKLRIHADELGPSGGSSIAAELGVRSADHLIFTDAPAADRLAAASVAATLLPAAAFYLKLGRFAPARMLIERGVGVALGSDVNPGGGFSPSMPFAMTLACFAMGLTFDEALVAATLNAAYALDRHARVGSLEAGKQMDAVVLRGPAIDLIGVGADVIRFVVKKGRIIDIGRSSLVISR